MENFLSIQSLILIIIVVVILFFLFREVNCWYWKINKRIKLQEDIILHLKIISNSINDQNENTKNEISKNDINLTDDEKRIIDSFEIKEGEKIIIHKRLRNIIKVSEKDQRRLQMEDWIVVG